MATSYTLDKEKLFIVSALSEFSNRFSYKREKIILDYDSSGDLLGIEIIGVSEIIDAKYNEINLLDKSGVGYILNKEDDVLYINVSLGKSDRQESCEGVFCIGKMGELLELRVLLT